jgi:hypothetical protein
MPHSDIIYCGVQGEFMGYVTHILVELYNLILLFVGDIKIKWFTGVVVIQYSKFFCLTEFNYQLYNFCQVNIERHFVNMGPRVSIRWEIRICCYFSCPLTWCYIQVHFLQAYFVFGTWKFKFVTVTVLF